MIEADIDSPVSSYNPLRQRCGVDVEADRLSNGLTTVRSRISLE